MEQTDYTRQDRLRNFGIGIAIAAAMTVMGWGLIVIAWAASL